MGQVWPPAPADTGWVDLTLVGSWTVSSGRTPQIRRIGNLVRVRGQVSGGTGTAVEIPLGFRTVDTTEIQPVATSTGGGHAYAQISAGSSSLSLTGGSSFWSLAGLSWFTDDPWPT